MSRPPLVCPWFVRRLAGRLVASAILGGTALFADAPALLAEEPAPTAATDSTTLVATPPERNDSGGLRGVLLRRGIGVEVDLKTDSSANVSGGLHRGGVVRGLVFAGLSIDTARLLGWPSGHLFAGFQAHQGRSKALVGDAQGFDNLDAVHFRQLSELWYEQGLLEGKLRLRVGKQDASRDFASVKNAVDFLNSSAGFSPTIQGFPSYPDPATGASLSVAPRAWIYSSAGIFDGATHEGCHGRTGNRGPSTLWGAPDALFVIAETGFRWTAGGGLAGRAGAGVWRHTGTFERFEGGQAHGTAGTYVVLEQGLWRADATTPDGSTAAAFAQLGWADGSVSDVDRHWSGGLTWTGLLPGRGHDVLGAMVSAVRFTGAPHASHLRRRETAVEALYRLRLLAWATLQSDLQLVANPAGGSFRRAVAGTARVEVAF